MKRFIQYILFCSLSVPLFSATKYEPLDQIISDFLSTDWPTVLSAKEKLENTGSACISQIVALMNDCRIHKLENTGDLIYPGAEKYYGHGQIIDYDIDDICIRAGWLLEEMTFMNFGFTGVHLADQELSHYIRYTFPAYYSDGTNQHHLDELTAAGKRKLIRSLSIEEARNWWRSNSTEWNRLSALEDALNSPDEKRQVKALFYIRNGKTRCIGLGENFYKARLENTIMTLSKSETSRVSENAKLIMLDSDFDWLSIKSVE